MPSGWALKSSQFNFLAEDQSIRLSAGPGLPFGSIKVNNRNSKRTIMLQMGSFNNAKLRSKVLKKPVKLQCWRPNEGTRYKEGTRSKRQEGKPSKKKVQVRHKSQEASQKTKKKGTRVESLVPWYLVSDFSFLTWLLALDPWIFPVPCLLDLTEG